MFLCKRPEWGLTFHGSIRDSSVWLPFRPETWCPIRHRAAVRVLRYLWRCDFLHRVLGLDPEIHDRNRLLKKNVSFSHGRARYHLDVNFGVRTSCAWSVYLASGLCRNHGRQYLLHHFNLCGSWQNYFCSSGNDNVFCWSFRIGRCVPSTHPRYQFCGALLVPSHLFPC